MLQNIKMILGLNNNDYDEMILLYLSKVETVVVSYCNIDKLNPALESFIEDKVVEVINPKINRSTQNTGEVKSVTRGDTKIEYNVGQVVTDNLIGAGLNDKDRKFLNQFRKLRFF